MAKFEIFGNFIWVKFSGFRSMYHIYRSHKYTGSLFLCWVKDNNFKEKILVEATHSFCDPVVIKEDKGFDYLGIFISFGSIDEWNDVTTKKENFISNDINIDEEVLSKGLLTDVVKFFSHKDSIINTQISEVNEKNSYITTEKSLSQEYLGPFAIDFSSLYPSSLISYKHLSQNEIDEVFQ